MQYESYARRLEPYKKGVKERMTSIHSAVGIRSWQRGMSLPNRHWIFPRQKQKQNKKWRDVLTVLFISSIVHTTSVCFEIFTAAFGSWARTALIVRTAKSEIQWMQTTLGRYPVQQTLRMRVCDCRALRKLSKRFSGAGGERLRGVCVGGGTRNFKGRLIHFVRFNNHKHSPWCIAFLWLFP